MTGSRRVLTRHCLGSIIQFTKIGGEEMPDIFKALTTVAAWILFVGGCISILVTTINWIVIVGFIGTPPIVAFLGWGLGAAELTLSAVVMILRKKME